MIEKRDSRYDEEAAAKEASKIKERVDKGLAENYQEANDDIDAENAAAFRKELLGLTGANEESDKLTMKDLRDFLGTEEAEVHPETGKLKPGDEDDIYIAERTEWHDNKTDTPQV